MRPTRAEWLLIGLLAVLAVAVRWAGLGEVSADMQTFFGWYGKLQAAGGVSGIGQHIGNYNAPFLYVLTLATFLPFSPLIDIKIVWFLFDALLVFWTYKIVALKWPGWRRPALAAVLMAVLPTVVINSSFYGQCDAIWAGFALAGVYQLLKQRPWLGVALCTVALAFKPQGIFIFPLLFLLVLAGRLRWWTVAAVPVVFVLLDLPSIIAGRSVGELLTVYAPERQARYVPSLTSNAASIWAFVPTADRITEIRLIGDCFAAIVVVGVVAVLIFSRAELDATRIVTAAAFFAIAMPFFLPGMHERYFFLGDVLTVVLAVYRPRLWFVPVLVQIASLLSYLPFLFYQRQHGHLLDLRILAALMFVAVLTTGYALVSPPSTSPESLPARRA